VILSHRVKENEEHITFPWHSLFVFLSFSSHWLAFLCWLKPASVEATPPCLSEAEQMHVCCVETAAPTCTIVEPSVTRANTDFDLSSVDQTLGNERFCLVLLKKQQQLFRFYLFSFSPRAGFSSLGSARSVVVIWDARVCTVCSLDRVVGLIISLWSTVATTMTLQRVAPSGQQQPATPEFSGDGNRDGCLWCDAKNKQSYCEFISDMSHVCCEPSAFTLLINMVGISGLLRSWKTWKSHGILISLFPGLEKSFKKNEITKVMDICYIHVFI